MARELSPAERQVLKGRAHPLHPVVMIGTEGLTDNVVREVERNLAAHELIKIRVPAAGREQREALMMQVCDATRASPVQHIGRILVVYREKPAAPALACAQGTPETPRRSAFPRRPSPRPAPERRASTHERPERTRPGRSPKRPKRKAARGVKR